MDKTIKKQEIQLIKDRLKSDFHNELLNKEYAEKIYKDNFSKNHIHINLSYIHENEEHVDFGMYISNNSNKDILIKKFPLVFCEDEIIKLEKYIEINKEISKYEAIHIEFKISKVELVNVQEYKNIKVYISQNLEVDKYPYVKIDMDDIPRINGYRNHRAMKKFIKNLSTIRKDELRIDVFKVAEAENGFGIISLFRNSSDKEVNIKSLPISVYTSHGLLIYKGVYTINDNSLKIDSNKGKLYYIEIPFTNLLKIEGHDLSTYKVEFK